METKINEILEELYALDPKLQKEGQLIRDIVSKIYAVHPEITADPIFIESLRNTILERISRMSHEPSRPLILSLLHSRYAYAVLTVIVAIIIIPSVTWINKSSVGRPIAEINNLQDEAFGDLAIQSLTGGAGGGGIRSQSGGGGGSTYVGNSMDAEMGMTTMYPGPDFTQVSYAYEGDDFEIPIEGFVYKRKITSLSGKSVASLIKNLPLSDLKNPLITDLSLSEDREFGYSISISIREGVISFYQNWEKWPVQNTVCAGDECLMRDLIAKSEFPENSRIIEIADGFLQEYNIDKSNYGMPRVMKPWDYGMPMPFPADNNERYSPEISVLYPLLIDETEVYDEWGNQVGMTVNVNLKFNRVVGAFNISLQNYEKSKYALTQDKEKILDLMKSGGSTGEMYVMDWQGKNLSVATGTPKLVFVQFYKFINGKQELMYAPALRFPIINIPVGASFFRENVIVPLVPDMVDSLSLRRLPLTEPIQVPMPVQGDVPVLEVEAINQ